jgi:hypothetical protein
VKGSRRGQLRGVAAGVLGVLAVVLLLLSAIAVWARRTVFDSAKVADLVTDAVNEPEVSVALADYLTQQVLVSVDVDAVVADVLPSQFERLEPAIASGIEGAIDRGINALLQEPAVQDQLEQLVERAHGAAMRLLEGDGLGDGISVSDGVVSLNLVPLVVRGLGRVQELGLLGDVDLPEATAAGDPDQQIADLEQALGRDLPDDFAQLVVYRSDSVAAAQASLESAQYTFALVKRALWLLLALTVVFVAATIVVARDRWRAALLLGLGAVVAMVVARTLVRRVRDDAPSLVERPGAKAAVDSLLSGASVGLLRTLGVVLALAVVLVAVAFFERGRQRRDLAAIIAVGAGAVMLALLGFSLGALLVAIVVAALVGVAVVRYWPSPPAATAVAE